MRRGSSSGRSILEVIDSYIRKVNGSGVVTAVPVLQNLESACTDHAKGLGLTGQNSLGAPELLTPTCNSKIRDSVVKIIAGDMSLILKDTSSGDVRMDTMNNSKLSCVRTVWGHHSRCCPFGKRRHLLDE